jgi:adenylate cyclase
MFTDMVGYSKLAQADEAAALAALARHNRLLRPIFVRFGGREIKTVGDAFLVEFQSALEGARCAVEIQRALHESRGDPGAVQIRIGLHVGDVVETDDDLLGDAVNIASRIEPLAAPGGICVSQQVYDQVRNKMDTPLVALPPVRLKNIRGTTPVYRFVLPWETGRPGAVLPPGVERPSGRPLAVLPLANISPDPHDEYFADGLTEELIASLSQVRGLSVIARTSVMPYKTAPKSLAQVGEDLGVDTVLEGSVRKAGNRIRITLQLIDVPSQRHVWASSYNRELDDVFAVQSDIAERTADALRLRLAPSEGPVSPRRPTENLAAYDVYLRGLVAAAEPGGSNSKEAFRYFAEATRLDPEFADAYAAWAEHYVRLASDYLPLREAMPRARELAARAVELDPNSSDAHAALGNIAMQFDHDWARMEQEYRRAIEINPSNLEAHRFFGLGLMALKRYPEAMAEFREVARLDPGGGHQPTLAWCLTELGGAEAALPLYLGEVESHPDRLYPHTLLGMYYVKVGRTKDALREAEVAIAPANGVERFDHAVLNALVGRPGPAHEIFAAADRHEPGLYISDGDRAMVHASLGEKGPALDLLEKDSREGDMTLWLYYRGVFFDSIRDEPRFKALLRKYRLPTRAPRPIRPSAGEPVGPSRHPK